MSVLELIPGDVFEGYIVKRALGRGGMGAVYLVHHPRFDAEMALKIMTLPSATAEELETHRVRFTREARTLVKLRHQSIIRVHDFAEHISDEGVCPYILMEFFPGKDGYRWVRENPSLDRVHKVAVQLAEALECAHGAGVLHRDLKHGNVLVNDADEAVLIDFGIAKSDADETVTETGLSVGTLSHMAPEYLKASMAGDNPEHTEQTDLWAFGCLLYFLTTHRHAFQSGGKGPGVLIRTIQSDPHPPVRSLRADASAEWEALIDDLLQKDPKKRLGSALQLGKRLRELPSPVDPEADTFVPPVLSSMEASKTRKTRELSSAAGAESKGADIPVEKETVAARKGLDTEDDPFAALKAKAPEPSESHTLGLPPLDDISGIQSAALGLQEPALAPAPEAPVQQEPAQASISPPPTTDPASSNPAPSEPTPLPSNGDITPKETSASDGEPSAAKEPPQHLGTFMGALVPERERSGVDKPSTGPVPNQESLPDDQHPHKDPTPRTGAFDVRGAVGAENTPDSAPDAQETASEGPAGPIEPMASAPEPTATGISSPAFAPPAPVAVSQKSAMRSLSMPLVGMVMTAGVILAVFWVLRGGPSSPSASVDASEAAARQVESEALKRAEARAEQELGALAEERAKAPMLSSPVSPMAHSNAPTLPNAMPGRAASGAYGASGIGAGNAAAYGAPAYGAQPPRMSASASGAPAKAPSPMTTAPVDPIAARYGNRNFNTGAFGNRPTPSTSSESGGTQEAAPTLGVKIPVRVNSEIASTASPVIAVVTQETRVGNLTLPAGAQIHGTSGRGAGGRVSVRFRFAVVGGRNVPLVGQALATDGRAGLPAERSLGNGSDVAARALSAAVQATANTAAALAGDNPVGAAISGGSGAAAQKAQRINSDEDVWLVKRGVRFFVYVGG